MARPDTYTDEEKQFLIENYPTQSWDFLLTEFNKISPVKRNKQALICKASSLGIKRDGVSNSNYTEEEDNLIRGVYNISLEHTLENNLKILIAEKMPHRTLRSVYTRACKLGIKLRKHWTQEEVEFIESNYYDLSTKQMAEILCRTEYAVYHIVQKLGLQGAPMSVYTEDDKRFVRDNYLKMSDEEIGKVLHRQKNSIKELRRKLGLRKPTPENVMYDLNRYTHRHNNKWKMDSAKACNYKCVITGKPFDDIHHLYARNLIIDKMLTSHPEYVGVNFNLLSTVEKAEIFDCFLTEQNKHPLGVCLTEEYHMMFHKMYGYGGNTPEQFYNFVKKVAPERLDYIMNL